tara:strand:+ start:2849 stop:3112 length:264 start_codon:yes stop_codon:yes gene_type:complete
MNENDYLESMNQLQEKYDTFMKEKETMEEEIEDLKKNLSSMYGLIRVLDIMANTSVLDVDDNLLSLIGLTRSFSSDIFNLFILKKNS